MKKLIMSLILSSVSTVSFASEFDNNIARALVEALRNSTVTCEEIFNNTGMSYGLYNKETLKSIATRSDSYHQEINLEEDPSVITYKGIDHSNNSTVERSSGQYWDISYILSPDEAAVDEVEFVFTDIQVKEVNIGTIPNPEFVTKSVETVMYKQICTVKEVNSTNI